jgi:Na+/proline symporter
MSPALILACVGGYFLFLLLIAWWTSRNATNAAYFLGNKASPWYAVAFGLIGDSLSGVTFISVPGNVGKEQFSYLQVVFGYVLGYAAIALVLLPLYYRLNLVSIYSYLEQRFGPTAQKTGASFFVLSRLAGAAARLFLAINVFQLFVFDQWRVPFGLTVSITIGLILAYTYRGGIRTLVWTDTFQSAFLLLGVVLSIVAIARKLGLGPGGLVSVVQESERSQIFFWEWKEASYFWKQFLGGAFIAIVMTGLDQNMMQKNLSCRSLGEAQKNIYSFTGVMVLVNVFFVSLGALLYHYAEVKRIGIPVNRDMLFPILALQHLGAFSAVVFVLGLTAATFSSADSVLTTLTTSFCIDVLGMERRAGMTDAQKTVWRHRAHVLFAIALWLAILAFKALNNESVIKTVLKVAGYTYGPLLGLFAYGLVADRAVHDKWTPLVCCAAPLLCFVIEQNSKQWLKDYELGLEVLLLNGLLTLIGLWLIRKPAHNSKAPTA